MSKSKIARKAPTKVSSKQAKQLIPAVAYTRKSTNRELEDGRHTQENSIQRQTEAVEALAAQYDCKIIRWYSDEGISGNKRGAARPDYNQMLKDAEGLGDFKAIVVDDFNRFTRGKYRKAMIDIDRLAEAGVESIISAKDGLVDITDELDAGIAHKSLATMMQNHEFLRTMSRSTLGGLSIRAREFKRSGGAPPYGMAGIYEMEDNRRKLTHLKQGDKKQVAIVKRIFNRFMEPSHPSLNSIAADLNREGVPSPRHAEKGWTVQGIKEILMRPCYKGEFTYGRKVSGDHFHLSDEAYAEETQGKVKPWRYRKPPVRKEGVYTPIVPPKVWDEAQKRLAKLSMKGSRRPRKDGYPLTGILICGHCKKPMYGCQPTGRKYRVYRCPTNAKHGMGSCGTYEIREEVILPELVKQLIRQFKEWRQMLKSQCPEDIATPPSQDTEETQREIAKATRTIDKIEEELFDDELDDRIRASLRARLKPIYDQRDKLRASLEARKDETEYSWEWYNELDRWCADLLSKSVLIEVDRKHVHFETKRKPATSWSMNDYLFNIMFESNVAICDRTDKGLIMWDGDGKRVKKEKWYLRADPRIVNEVLHTLGTWAILRWRKRSVTLSNGETQNRYTLIGYEWKLGNQNGKITGENRVSFSTAKAAGSYSGTRDGDRCDTRKGRG